MLRAEEQLEPLRVFLEWEVETWLVDRLKHMKPWDPLVLLPWSCLLSLVSQVHGVPIVLGRRAECGIPAGELGWALPLPSLS